MWRTKKYNKLSRVSRPADSALLIDKAGRLTGLIGRKRLLDIVLALPVTLYFTYLHDKYMYWQIGKVSSSDPLHTLMCIKLQDKTNLLNFTRPSPAIQTDPVMREGLTLGYKNSSYFPDFLGFS